MTLLIRPEHPADNSAIAALLQAAFPQNTEARKVDLLRKSPAFIP